jgi:catechol 2,3-dioxygenase-like lactoylglutathione lyase family enzyme
MTDAMMIPVFPCTSLDETLGFYRSLGFEVTHEQARPYVYAALQRGEIHLHFHGRERLNPAESFSTCLAIVDEVEPLHRSFAAGLRGAYGKLPIAGVPRITRLRKGQGRFTLVDPAGNSVIFIQSERQERAGEEAPAQPQSRMARALATAAVLRDSKGDDAAAAKVLDAALRRKEPATPVERARALAARAELAVALGDETRAAALLAELEDVPLSEADRERLRDELEAAEELARTQR